MRALSEVVQTRVTYISGSRDDFLHADYQSATDDELLQGIWEEISNPANTEPSPALMQISQTERLIASPLLTKRHSDYDRHYFIEIETRPY